MYGEMLEESLRQDEALCEQAERATEERQAKVRNLHLSPRRGGFPLFGALNHEVQHSSRRVSSYGILAQRVHLYACVSRLCVFSLFQCHFLTLWLSCG